MFRTGWVSSGSKQAAPSAGRLPGWRAHTAAAVLALGVVFGGGSEVQARDARPAADSAAISLQALPPEAQKTHQLILAGGPFPYDKDGTVFGNRERQLPSQPRGYYREYTVKTPGSRDRGARRIVCGGQPPAPPDACFYTDDHYASFRRIAP